LVKSAQVVCFARVARVCDFGNGKVAWNEHVAGSRVLRARVHEEV
jgi:hypothetical protein